MFLLIVKCQVAKNQCISKFFDKDSHCVQSDMTNYHWMWRCYVQYWQRHVLPSQDFINQALADPLDILLKGLDSIFKPSAIQIC